MTNIILKSPVVTEKATALAQKNVYAFIVSLLATKDQIRNAVESYYGVKVGSIRITIRKGKVQRVGKRMVPKLVANKKIAYITVTKGSISLFPKA
ncbi:50S ribosomal protein L23 [Candidatus Roizmanbacteria bacterium CG03_land_8_20_14_0_80_39_12]|uniref:Large ribosomal subunit protein uL23 n=2 Tax=Candidatus Roizmaniibacteriota TaxID=1752723 RepID=A0A2M7BTQ4_9BACT|nr:MAG: 50S ribosomal protein L23 [Candidatus Roizmanbacteria bacterium CG03_land_8_20_14_0_80_39_12]